MHNYTGIKCPHCDIPFQKDDDIVVCPACGAPYHRHCYEEIGHCLFIDEHASGKVWAAPESPKAPNPDNEIKDKECTVCGTMNNSSALFCNRCGSPLIGAPEVHQNRTDKRTQNPEQSESIPNPQENPVFWNGFAGPLPFDLMGGVNPTEMIDDDVSFGEVSKLVRQNTIYYMPRFRYIKISKRNKFNLSAFLFGGAWMLYRKMYTKGAVFAILQFGLYLAYIFTSMFVSAPTLAQILQSLGIDYTQGLSLNTAELLAVYEILAQNPALYLKIASSLICLVLLLILMIYSGITSNKAYMKHSIHTIKLIKKEDAGHGDISLALEEKGGVNLGIAVCMLVCYMIINSLPTFI